MHAPFHILHLCSGAKKRSLKKDAVPTIFPDFPPSLQPKPLSKRRVLKRSATSAIKTCRTKRKKKREIVAKVNSDHSYPYPCTIEEKLQDHDDQLINTRKKLKAVSRKNTQLQKRVCTLEKMLKEVKEKFGVQDHALTILQQAGSEIPECLFRRLTKNLKSNTTTREEYPPALRSFAMTLHFYSPKAYR
jgi:septal ring factor EnvC (AmiA/AmiB activator)